MTEGHTGCAMLYFSIRSEPILKWAAKITCVLMKWHWFSTDMWAATKCNQILCKSNLGCSILMMTFLAVTLISGSCLFSFNEPKVVCIPQKRETVNRNSESCFIQHLHLFLRFDWICIYLRIQGDFVSNKWVKCPSLKILLESQIKITCRESFRRGQDISADFYAELRISFGKFFYNLKRKCGSRVKIKSLLILLWTFGDVIIF